MKCSRYVRRFWSGALCLTKWTGLTLCVMLCLLFLNLCVQLQNHVVYLHKLVVTSQSVSYITFMDNVARNRKRNSSLNRVNNHQVSNDLPIDDHAHHTKSLNFTSTLLMPKIYSRRVDSTASKQHAKGKQMTASTSTGESNTFLNQQKEIQNTFLNQQKEIQNIWNFSFVIVPSYNICTLNTHQHGLTDHRLVVLFVHSRVETFEDRELIRQTWGSVRRYRGFHFVVIFILGVGYDLHTQNAVELESKQYGDIVQGNFKDNYRNLTHKHLLAYKWINNHCSQAEFVVKLDDDTLVNVFKLAEFLSAQPNHGLLYCSVFMRIGPRRDTTDKWYVSQQEYPYSLYPPYCEGFAYIVSAELLPRLYKVSMYTPFYWIDDVYVTGFLAAKLGIKHSNFRQNYSFVLLNPYTPVTDHQTLDSVLYVLAKYNKDATTWKRTWNEIVKLYEKHGM